MDENTSIKILSESVKNWTPHRINLEKLLSVVPLKNNNHE
jgi:hypothetical protein